MPDIDPTDDPNSVEYDPWKNKDSLEVTPQMALIETLRMIEKGKWKDRPPDKLIIIAVWDEDGGYDTSWINAGCKVSEIHTACHHVAHRAFHNLMNVKPTREDEE